MDKNGVLVTKHVRSDLNKKSPLAGIPSPSLSMQVEFQAANTVQKRWRINTNKWVGDHELMALCKEKFNPAQTYECSDAEVFDVLSAVGPENVLPLLSLGFRSGEDARSFLQQAKLDRLVQDNADVTAEAITRGIPVRSFLEFASSNNTSMRQKTFMDAAEVDANPEMRKVDLERKDFTSLSSISTMVLTRWIRASDLKELGEDIVLMYGSKFDPYRRSRDLIWDQLHLLKQKKLAYKSASEMRQVILDGGDRLRDIEDILICAGLYGVEETKGVMPGFLHDGGRLQEAIMDRSVTDRRKAFDYVVSLRKKGIPANTEPADKVLLLDADVPVDVAADGINEGLTAVQIIAMHQGEVVPSISKGWL